MVMDGPWVVQFLGNYVTVPFATLLLAGNLSFGVIVFFGLVNFPGCLSGPKSNLEHRMIRITTLLTSTSITGKLDTILLHKDFINLLLKFME